MSTWTVDVHDGRARYEGTPTRILEDALRLIPEEPGIDVVLRVVAAVHGVHELDLMTHRMGDEDHSPTT